MTRIIGIPGSLRTGSLNALLLAAAAKAAPEDVLVEVASIRGIPLYDGDLEAAEGIPAAVTVLKNKIAAADGLLLVTPEYNHSLPGVFKNAIDWLSRPPGDIPQVFRGKAVALMGATPGGMGTVYSQTAWLPVFRALGMRPWFGRSLYVSQAHKAFDSSGALSDGQLKERLRDFVVEYAAFIAGQ